MNYSCVPMGNSWVLVVLGVLAVYILRPMGSSWVLVVLRVLNEL